jgi:hypothetical protein
MFEYNVSSVVYDAVAGATEGALRRQCHNRKTILRFSAFYPGELIRCNHAHVPSKARPAPEKLFEPQSPETDRDKRKHLEIDRQLQGDGARPIIHRRHKTRKRDSNLRSPCQSELSCAAMNGCVQASAQKPPVQLDLFCVANHSSEPGVYGLDGLRFVGAAPRALARAGE